MLEYPVYVRMPTEENKSYLANKSGAEAVIGTLINAQNQGWMRLHGFVILPDCLEIVMSPIKQGVSGVAAHLQSEMIPILSVLLPEAKQVWERHYSYAAIKTEKSLQARLNMLLLAPVAMGVCETAEEYPYSSANPRYKANVANYAGFSKPAPAENLVLSTNENSTAKPTPSESPVSTTNGNPAAKPTPPETSP